MARTSTPQLMLVTPLVSDDEAFPARFLEAIGAAGFAAVVLRTTPDTDERGLLKLLKPLVEAAQETGAAVLIEGAPDLVGKSGADGIHALGERNAREAASRFKPEKILGVAGLRTRDAAMAAGEIGADYVLFGEPGKAGETPPSDATVERLEWWAEIFVTPCVGQAERADDVAAIAASGADFVAFGEFVWSDPAGPAAAIQTACAALSPVEAAS